MEKTSDKIYGENNQEIGELLEKYRLSQLDEQPQTTYPFFKAETEFTSVYKFIHDLATSRVLTKLQLRLDDITIASELPLEFGRVNGAASSKIALTNGGELIIFIEVKTGRVKLIQPAIYTYFEGVKTLVAELKTGEVLIIDVKTAERLIKELVKHISDKEKLRKLKKRIPGRECAHCGSNCEFRSNEERNYNPLKSLPRILDNIEIVVEKIVAEITKEVRRGEISSL
jgi:hypothetical protein